METSLPRCETPRPPQGRSTWRPSRSPSSGAWGTRDRLAVWYVGKFRMSRRHTRHEPLRGPQHRYNNALKEKTIAEREMDTRTDSGSFIDQT